MQTTDVHAFPRVFVPHVSVCHGNKIGAKCDCVSSLMLFSARSATQTPKQAHSYVHCERSLLTNKYLVII